MLRRVGALILSSDASFSGRRSVAAASRFGAGAEAAAALVAAAKAAGVEVDTVELGVDGASSGLDQIHLSDLHFFGRGWTVGVTLQVDGPPGASVPPLSVPPLAPPPSFAGAMACSRLSAFLGSGS